MDRLSNDILKMTSQTETWTCSMKRWMFSKTASFFLTYPRTRQKDRLGRLCFPQHLVPMMTGKSENVGMVPKKRGAKRRKKQTPALSLLVWGRRDWLQISRPPACSMPDHHKHAAGQPLYNQPGYYHSDWPCLVRNRKWNLQQSINRIIWFPFIFLSWHC